MTPNQQSIINKVPGHHVVFAAPGSGKTTVLTKHLARQLELRRIQAQSTMAITFTRQAAMDIKSRLIAVLPNRSGTQSFRIGTFHAQLFRMLLAVMPDIPVILNPQEQIELMRIAAEREGLGSKKKVRELLGLNCRIKSVGGEFGAVLAPSKRTRRVFEGYEKLKKHSNRWDFDDILVSALHLLKIRRVDVAKFPVVRYLLIDEFQDTNLVQWLIIEELYALWGCYIFVVGDEDQAIYGFRGSDAKYLLEFPNQFEGVSSNELDINFRSDKEIVLASSLLIARNQDRSQKHSQVFSSNKGHCVCYRWRDEGVEAAEVWQIISKNASMTHPGKAFPSVAILARTRAQLVQVARLKPQKICDGTVQFRTFHDAKGKEWDEVHIVGAVQENPYLKHENS